MKKTFRIIPIIIVALGILSISSIAEAQDLRTRLSGRILLAVEEKGEAWYVDPSNKERYFLGKPIEAFNLMQQIGLGISNETFDSYKGKAPARLSGRILLKVEDFGKAYYVNPIDLKMYFLGRPQDAFMLMRRLGMGISNANLATIPTFAHGIIQRVEVDYQSTKYDNVIIRDVVTRATGWIVIHKVENDEPGDVVGYSAIKVGLNHNVNVRLIGITKSQDLIAMIHYDLGQKSVFEYPGFDVPVMLNNEIVMKKFFTTHMPSVNMTIQIINSSFNPRNMTVKRGATVTWINNDSAIHTVTLEGKFDSGNLTAGKSFSRIFNFAGQYDYHCSIHPSMTGTVTVVD